jgi:hypothetical protein
MAFGWFMKKSDTSDKVEVWKAQDKPIYVCLPSLAKPSSATKLQKLQ